MHLMVTCLALIVRMFPPLLMLLGQLRTDNMKPSIFVGEYMVKLELCISLLSVKTLFLN